MQKKKILFAFAATLIPAFAALAQSPFGEFQVRCSRQDDCPSAVGALLRKPSGGCTGFLVAPDVVATNLHCLPEDTRKKGARCEGQIEMRLPESGAFQSERLECQEVLAVSTELSEHATTQDYAFLRMKTRSERRPIPLSRQGLKDGQMAKIYRIMFQKGENFAVLSMMKCPAVQRSILNPFFTSDISPLVFLSPCPVVEGNSGSPILDGSGRARAILNAKHRERLPEDLGLTGERETGAEISGGSGTNFACVRLGFRGETAAPACAIDTRTQLDVDKAVKALIDSALQPLIPRIEKRVRQHSRKLHQDTLFSVRWKLENENLPASIRKKGPLFRIRAIPECFFPFWEKRNNLDILKPSEVPIRFLHHTWIMKATFDPQFRIQAQAVELRESAELRFDAGRNAEEGEGPLEMRRRPAPGESEDTDRTDAGGMEKRSVFRLKNCVL